MLSIVKNERGTQLCGPQVCVPYLEEYNLGTKSNISRIKTALRDRELIDITKEGVFLEDPVFKMWLKKR